MPAFNALCCFLAALIWGTTFVAQKIGGDIAGPFTFNGIRSLMGCAALLPLVVIRRRRRCAGKDVAAKGTGSTGGGTGAAEAYDPRMSLIGGICCGLFLCSASMLQQIAIGYVEVGKAGFLTALYIVLVPVLSFFLTGRGSSRVWTAVLISLAGLYFLCMNGASLRIGGADVMLLACALLFAAQIMSVDHFVMKTDAIEIACMQMLTSSVICIVIAFAAEKPDLAAFGASVWFSIIYAGVFSSGIAYTLQAVGQKGADPAIASLIMSLESVISAIAGFVLLHQKLTARELLGCALMFAAIVLVELPTERRRGKSADTVHDHLRLHLEETE